MKNVTSQSVVIDKLLKIARNLAVLGAAMFAGMAAGFEILRQLRHVARRRQGDELER